MDIQYREVATMTNLAVFPPHSRIDENEQLAEQITLLAGQVNAAIAAGQISYSKVHAMTGAPAARLATPVQ